MPPLLWRFPIRDKKWKKTKPFFPILKTMSCRGGRENHYIPIPRDHKTTTAHFASIQSQGVKSYTALLKLPSTKLIAVKLPKFSLPTQSSQPSTFSY